jgi:hypothetical protein
MAKLSTKLSGRKVGDVVVLKEGAPGGMRKVRCPISQQLATPAVRADGTRVYRTPSGVEYRTKRF